MDPSIMKLLEEDEDESMHSGADVEAFQAALNRDLGGDASASQPSDSESVISQGQEGNRGSNQPIAQWQSGRTDENTNFQYQRGSESAQIQEQHSSEMELKQQGTVVENQQHHNVSVPHLPLQQKQPQEDGRQGRSEQIPSQIPPSTGFQMAEKNPIPRTELERLHNQEGVSQLPKVQKMSNQQGMGGEQATNPMKPGKQVPFALLLPSIMPSLDKDRAMQLHTLYNKLKRNEITKDVFVRHMRDIVGDQMLKLAVSKMQTQSQAQAAVRQQQLRMSLSVSAGSTQFHDTQSFPQLHQKGTNTLAESAHIPASSVPIAQKPQELERQSGSHGMLGSHISSSASGTIHQERERSSVPVQALNKQQHLHFPQSSFSIYGGTAGSYHPYPGANVNPSGSSMKPHPHDSQMRQISQHQSMGSASAGSSNQAMNMMSVPKFERPNSTSDPAKLPGGPLSQFTNNSTLQQNAVHWQTTPTKEQSSGPLSPMTYVKMEPIDQVNEQHKSQSSTSHGLSAAQVDPGNAAPGPSKDETLERQSPRMGFSTSSSMVATSSVSPSTTTQTDPSVPLSSRMLPSVNSPAGINARTPPKKPSVGQKKPVEALGSSPPPSSKKQKVAGAYSDQSIEQLNDVTAVSGVNLREEEEQLFSGPKEDSRASEASRRVVQEEEERLILQKSSLQKRLAEIMAKCGLKNIGNDVERCLSLCVEERMRGLLSSLIRLSKQRADAEKSRHRTVITSDVRQQILNMNQKAKEEWEKKQAEAEKIRKLNEPEGENGVDGDKEKDDGRGKSVKGHKEDDDKMRTTAANVAARAAVGGDDMLSKWQLMAEQARQKREGVTDAASSSQAGKDVNRKTLSTAGRNMKDSHEPERRGQGGPGSTGASRKFGRNQGMASQNRVARTVSVKDLVAVLEREPQMSKSTLVYRLYERMRSDTTAE